MLARFPGGGPVALGIFPDPVTGRYKEATWQQFGEELHTWGFLYIPPHAAHGMRGLMPSPGSCRVTPGKHRLPQHFQVSSGDTAQHDPETPCSSPERREGG
ncbi:MAG: hypothetical protein AB7N91_10150 [Candidatus Tectimicrobiota bacterium]